MTVSLKHTTQAAGTDAGNGEIRKAQWNEEHTLSLATGKLLGRSTAGTGTVEEITPGTGLTISAGNLDVSTVPVANGGTGQQNALTQGGVIYSSSTTAMATTTAGTAGQALVSAGTSAPAFGTLPVSGGGTGVTSSTGSGAVVLGTGPTITGAALNGTVGATTPSTGAFTTVTATSTVSDSAGDVRTLVNNAKVAAYILAATDNGEMINITTGGVTVNSGIFSVGQNVTIYNNSASSQTVTQGAGVTLRLAGSATTGNRTLALRGICTIVCVASNEFVVSGAGLS